MAQETTLILFKPDAIKQDLVGTVLARYQAEGFKICGIKMMALSDEILAEHYAHIAEMPFFPSVRGFMQETPVVALALSGDNVITRVRDLLGPTDSKEAAAGTIRGDLAVNIGRNVIHGSDAPETAAFEIGLWFQPSELSDWTPSDQGWRVEG